MINAQVVAHSKDKYDNELISYLITFPRIILAEFNTHRMFSKNTSSSRAIPFEKMVSVINLNPFVPYFFQRHHTGMQGTEYITDEEELHNVKNLWLNAMDDAITRAEILYKNDVTKQLCNRLLEPFMWTTMLVTTGKEGLQNFFNLRCPQYNLFYENVPMSFKSKKELLQFVNKVESDEFKYDNLSDLDWLNINTSQAEIHIQILAEAMYDVYNESTAKELKPGEWHIPFGDKIDISNYNFGMETQGLFAQRDRRDMLKVKVATAMAARTSYTVVGDEKQIDYKKLIELHDRLLDMHHMSPFEHCARTMTPEEYVCNIKGLPDLQEFIYDDDYAIAYHKVYEDNPEAGWCRNFKGFIQYREIIEK